MKIKYVGCDTRNNLSVEVQWDQSSPGNSASHYSDQSGIKLDLDDPTFKVSPKSGQKKKKNLFRKDKKRYH